MVQTLSQMAEARPTKVAPPKSWMRVGGRAWSLRREEEVEDRLVCVGNAVGIRNVRGRVGVLLLKEVGG